MLNDLYINLDTLHVSSMNHFKNTYQVSTTAAMMLQRLNIIQKPNKFFIYVGPIPSLELAKKILKAQSRYIGKLPI